MLEVDQDFFAARLLSESQQVGDEIAGAPGLIHDLAHKAVLFVGEVFLRPELLGITHDGGKGMVDLVGGAGHEIAKRSQLFFLDKLALQPLLALVSAAGFLQQGHECLVLKKLSQEYECRPIATLRPRR